MRTLPPPSQGLVRWPTTIVPEPAEYRFVFLHGLTVRTGTNYAGALAATHPEVRLLGPGRSSDEFSLLATMPAWREALARLSDLRRPDQFSFEEFGPYLGRAWLDFLAHHYEIEPGTVFLKAPSVRSIGDFFVLFPSSRLVLWYRDARDQARSARHAALAKRASDPPWHGLKRRIDQVSRRGLVYDGLVWSRAAREARRFSEEVAASPFAGQLTSVRFEDAVNDPRGTAEVLFRFMRVRVDEDVLRGAEAAPVVGSSFTTGRVGEKPGWEPRKRSAEFRPVGRHRDWNPIDRAIISALTRSERHRLGYR